MVKYFSIFLNSLTFFYCVASTNDQVGANRIPKSVGRAAVIHNGEAGENSTSTVIYTVSTSQIHEPLRLSLSNIQFISVGDSNLQVSEHQTGSILQVFITRLVGVKIPRCLQALRKVNSLNAAANNITGTPLMMIAYEMKHSAVVFRRVFASPLPRPPVLLLLWRIGFEVALATSR